MVPQQQAVSLRSVGRLGVVAQRTIAWSLAAGFAALVAGLLAAGLGHIVELLFPVAAVLVGAILYFKHPTVYLGFTWWLWFLAPMVRRVVDYQIGWNPLSPVQLAPFLVAGLATLTLVRYLPRMLRSAGLFPFMLVLVGLNYGYMIGLVQAGPAAATFGLLTWIVPVVFGFHVSAHWQQYPLYRDTLQQVFLWGVLLMGLYGIVQYVAMLPWDAYWMEASEMTSLFYWLDGYTSSVRVWSTMNSPQPFALTMMAGLLFAFAAKGSIRFIAATSGYVAFLLSFARTAWLGWAVGAILLLVRMSGAQKLRMVVIAVLFGLFSLPLLLLLPADIITGRFESMRMLEDDGSYQDRMEVYVNHALGAMTHVVGEGIGATNLVATRLTEDGGTTILGDAGVLELPFTLGWPGSLLYLGGLGWLVGLAVSGAQRNDTAAQAAYAVVWATLAQMVSYNILVGAPGMVFWSFLGLALSARMFHRNRKL